MQIKKQLLAGILILTPIMLVITAHMIYQHKYNVMYTKKMGEIMAKRTKVVEIGERKVTLTPTRNYF